jgi:hypothetical protein
VCCVAASDPRCFLPVTMCDTTYAHLLHMCSPLSASTRKSLHTCSLCLHRWRVPQFALKYPCNLPTPPWRPSFGDRLLPPHPGDRRALTREFARGVQGRSRQRGSMSILVHVYGKTLRSACSPDKLILVYVRMLLPALHTQCKDLHRAYFLPHPHLPHIRSSHLRLQRNTLLCSHRNCC